MGPQNHPHHFPIIFPGVQLPGRGTDGPAWLSPQYFEYTSQRELRHNIGKELCLRAATGTADLGECQFRGKPGRVPASEEWDLAQVRRSLRPGDRPWARVAPCPPWCCSPGAASLAPSPCHPWISRVVSRQNRLIKNLASGLCLTARGKHPALVPCDLTDPHQLWSFT